MVQNAGLRILRSFNNQNTRSFVELCKEAGYPTDLGGYYLRQLLQSNYLEKGERGLYILTPKGRRFLTITPGQKTQSVRPHVLVVPQLDKSFVVLERNQQPFLNRKEWPATQIQAGESKDKALQRLLSERLAKATNVSFRGVFRRIDRYGGEIFDDKLFLVHSVILQDKPVSGVVNGVNLVVQETQLLELTYKSRSLLDIKNFLEPENHYEERVYELDFADFEPGGK